MTLKQKLRIKKRIGVNRFNHVELIQIDEPLLPSKKDCVKWMMLVQTGLYMTLPVSQKGNKGPILNHPCLLLPHTPTNYIPKRALLPPASASTTDTKLHAEHRDCSEDGG